MIGFSIAPGKATLWLHPADVVRCKPPSPPHRYYCEHCGAAVGQFTPYIPYIDIPFFADFYGRLWRRVWFERGVSLASRALGLLIILLAAPVMLIGLPFAIARRGRRRGDADSDR